MKIQATERSTRGDKKDKKVEKLEQDQGVKAKDIKPEDKADLAQDINE